MAPQLLAQHTVHTDWLTRLTRLTRQTVRLTFFFQQLSAHSLTSKLQEPMCPKPQNHSKWLHWLHWLHQIIWFILNSLWLFLILLFDYTFWCLMLHFQNSSNVLLGILSCLENSKLPTDASGLHPVDLQRGSRLTCHQRSSDHQKSIKVTGSHRKSPLCFCLTSSLISLPYYHLIYRSLGVSISVSVRKTLSGPQSSTLWSFHISRSLRVLPISILSISFIYHEPAQRAASGRIEALPLTHWRTEICWSHGVADGPSTLSKNEKKHRSIEKEANRPTTLNSKCLYKSWPVLAHPQLAQAAQLLW